MEIHPIPVFQSWFQQHLNATQMKIPTACCLSTIGLDNYPNARFVSLKEVSEGNFIVTGPLTSRKGLEIQQNNKVALTFWWAETERQVRVQGNAIQIPSQLADNYFAERNKDSQIVSTVSHQGQEIFDMDELMEKYNELYQKNNELTRPENWGGYAIKPFRIEFLQFKATRFHERKLYEFEKNKWMQKYLQP